MKGTPLTAVRSAVVALLLTLTLQVTANADGWNVAGGSLQAPSVE